MIITTAPRRLIFVAALLFFFSIATIVAFDNDDSNDLLTRTLSNKKTLVIVDTGKIDAVRSSHSQWFDLLERQHGYELEFRTARDSSISLEQYGQYRYHNLILMTSEDVSSAISTRNILQFVDSGNGNVIIVSGTKLSGSLRQVAMESGVDFDDNGVLQVDHFHHAHPDVAELHAEGGISGRQHTVIIARQFAPQRVVLGDKFSSSSNNNAGVLFRGIGMTLESQKNALLVPILRGNPTSYGFDASNGEPSNSRGSNSVLVAGLQARNSARMTFVGSMDMLSNRFFDQSTASNRDFANELLKWSLQERGVLRARNVHHAKVHESTEDQVPQPTTTTLKSYRITDEIDYSVVVEEWDGERGQWVPFVADDIQIEFIMLHPYIRTSLKHKGDGVYGTRVKLPDVYGVYKFFIDYRRTGYSGIKVHDQVAIRPLKLDEYERFIPSAYPYYAGLFSVMGAFGLFCFLYLHTVPATSASGKTKSE